MKSTRMLSTIVLQLVLLLLIPTNLLATPGAVMLKNGNVVQGQVHQYATHVVVINANSQIRLPLRDVELVARDIDSIYRSRAAAAKTPATMSSLITWCLKNQLHHHAIEQLGLLRQKHPNAPSLPLLSRQVAAASKKSTNVLPGKGAVPQDAQFAQQNIDRMSQATLSQFARHIQPLMLNRCAMANCHGKASSTPFKLRGAGSSVIALNLAQRNLGATLQQIGGVPAEQSLLWMSASQAHGSLKQAALNRGELERLYIWIARAAGEMGTVSSMVQQASFTMPVAGDVDPFDPAVFNSASN